MLSLPPNEPEILSMTSSMPRFRALAAFAAAVTLVLSLRASFLWPLVGVDMARSSRLSVSRSLSMEVLTKAESSELLRKCFVGVGGAAAVARPRSSRMAQHSDFI